MHSFSCVQLFGCISAPAKAGFGEDCGFFLACRRFDYCNATLHTLPPFLAGERFDLHHRVRHLGEYFPHTPFAHRCSLVHSSEPQLTQTAPPMSSIFMLFINNRFCKNITANLICQKRNDILVIHCNISKTG